MTSTPVYAVRRPPVTSRFGGFCLAYDGRNGRRQRLGLLRRGGAWAALLPGVPAFARSPLLVSRQIGAVLIADETGARATRPVGATLHAAAHVERAPRTGRLGGKPHDA